MVKSDLLFNQEIIVRNSLLRPLLTPLDIYKMMYQASNLVGHLVNNDYVSTYLENELANLGEVEDTEIYEYISTNVVRINIVPYLESFSKQELLDLFVKSASIKTNIKIEELFDLVSNDIKEELVNINNKLEGKAPSHSNEYHESYNPHYRVVAAQLLPIELRKYKLIKFINRIKEDNEKIIIALDGPAASGKSTITKDLTDVTVIHMDNHFNDYHDVINIVNDIKQLDCGSTYLETCYDCHTNSYYEVEKTVNNVIIIEGVYSYIEYLRPLVNYLVFMVVNNDEQINRINSRSNKDDYFNKWLINENKYFSSDDFINHADILI